MASDMNLIDALGADRRDALRRLAGYVEASDDLAVTAWAAWQSFAGLSPKERTKALSIVIALEEMRRKADGLPPNFHVESRPRVVRT